MITERHLWLGATTIVIGLLLMMLWQGGLGRGA